MLALEGTTSLLTKYSIVVCLGGLSRVGSTIVATCWSLSGCAGIIESQNCKTMVVF